MQTCWKWYSKQSAALAVAVLVACAVHPAQALIDTGFGGTDGSGGSLDPGLSRSTSLRPLGWGGNSFGQVGDRSTQSRKLPVAVPGGALAVATGNGHTLALRVDRTVWAWGANHNGQLGDGTTTAVRARPVQVLNGNNRPLMNVVAVSAGLSHSLAIRADGTVWQWGLMRFDAGGGIDIGPRAVPAGVRGAVAVSAGRSHSLALMRDGSVWAWGNNYFGQLGNGSRTSSTGYNAPAPVRGLFGVVGIAAGHYHSLALLSDGTVRAWGNNSYGQLGNGTQLLSTLPTAVNGLVGVREIGAGFSHSLALLGDGTVRAWGANEVRQLGSTEWGSLSVGPVPVRGLSGARKISTWSMHCLAVRTDGTVYAWGNNQSGRLGVGSTSDAGGAGQVTRLTQAVIAVAGEAHSLAVREDGTFLGWGANGMGQLGTGSPTAEAQPAPVLAIGVRTPVKGIAAGGGHSLALLANGVVQAWGNDAFGQLGDGDTPPTPSGEVFQHPLVLHPTGTTRIGNIVAVAAGEEHSLVLRSDGRVFAFGRNTFGQLGNATTTDSPLPVLVKGPGTEPSLSSVVAVSAGVGHSMALRSDGTVWAWGGNRYGQLGSGTGIDSSRPIRVGGLLSVKAISAGGYHNLALRADGTVWSWGHNGSGQLGNGTTVDSSWPGQARGLSGVRTIDAGQFHSLALLTDGTVSAWGYNAFGQVGDGTRSTRPTPVRALGLTGIAAVSAGGYHSLALVSDGSIRAWGYNGSGQLGDGTLYSRLSPVPSQNSLGVGKLTEVGIVSAGRLHSLAGTAYR